ncbi:agamous-like MADS-box protein AGL29 [Primulina eburnea]|uniref:agamous-like MADS-box protein AGL29 n=1 Tax=Primulina eburnea TaxID=1245227 RepID=UPI003C6C2DB8
MHQNALPYKFGTIPHSFLHKITPNSSSMAPPKGNRKSLGRRKIEMKLIADENARVVTFSKRRNGLFKKATELSTLCGAKIAIIVFSPCKRAYSFGSPNVDYVTDQFLNQFPMQNPQSFDRGMNMQQLKDRCDKINEELEIKKRKGKEIEEGLESFSCRAFTEDLDSFDLATLKEMKKKLESLREQVSGRINRQGLGSGEGSSHVRVSCLEEGNESPIPSDWLKL